MSNTRFNLRVVLCFMVGSTFAPLAFAQESVPADLPSAESILDRFIEVTGGADAYESLTSAMTQGTMGISAAGITGQLEIYIKPGQYYMHVELPGVGVIESGVTDGIAWESNVLTGPRILEGAEAELTIVGAHPAAAAHWRDMYKQVETVGVADVNGESAYEVSMTTGQGFNMSNFYGVESGLLLKQAFVITTQGIQLPIQQYFHDYAEDGGITSAARIVTDQGVGQVEMRFTSGEYNADIPDERFAMPEAVVALLP